MSYIDQIRYFDPNSGIPIIKDVPLRSKAGFMYVFQWESVSKSKDWRADGYRWRQNAKKTFMYGDVKCVRYYFKLQVGPEDFTTTFSKHAIVCPLYEKQILIWYSGDESVVVDFAHGNAQTKGKAVFHRTAPSLLTSMKSDTSKKPLEIYSDLMLAAPLELDRYITDAPKDFQQVKNALKTARASEKLSSDALYNLIEIRSETQFISDLAFAPNFIVLGFNKDTVQEFKKLIDREDLPPQCLSYDTTFDTGDFYLSTLTFRQTEFCNQPTIPLFFLIHEERHQDVHDYFFRRVAQILPELASSKKVIIVTDEEAGIVNAVKNHLPKVPRFRCWIHALKDIKEKLRKLGVRDKSEYKKDFIDLLNQESATQYKTTLSQFYLKKWKREFSGYFDKHIDPDMNNMGSWALRKYGVILLTTNQSESFNATLKRFNQWKKLSTDMMIISLIRLDQFFNRRIQSGRYGIGDYKIRPHLKSQYVSNKGVVLEKVLSFEELFEQLKMKRPQPNFANGGNSSATEETQRFLYVPSESAKERAQRIIDENRIHHVPADGKWTIRGSAGDDYVVRLFKNGSQCLTCTCPATTICCHLMAAMLSIDCKFTTGKKGNTTTFRKNARKRPFKRAGRKGPIKESNDVAKKSRLSCINSENSLTSVQQELLNEEQEMDRVIYNANLSNDAFHSQHSPLPSSQKPKLTESVEKSGLNNLGDSFNLSLSPVASKLNTSLNEETTFKIIPIVLNGSPIQTKKQSDSVVSCPLTPTEKNTVLVTLDSVGRVEMTSEESNQLKSIIEPIRIKRKRERSPVMNKFQRREILSSKEIAFMMNDKLSDAEKLLKGRYINAAQRLIRKQFPDIGGLYCPSYGMSANFPKTASKRWLQIVHDGENHWVLTARGFPENSKGKEKKTERDEDEVEKITVYDSLNFNPDTRKHVVACLSALCRSENKTISYTVIPTQKQDNGYDCGIFSIVFATSLAFGEDPSCLRYDPLKIREHLGKCYTQGKLEPFPSKIVKPYPSRGKSTFVQEIWCHCRRTDYRLLGSKWEMVKCNGCEPVNWFHRMCEKDVPSLSFGGKWFCKLCKVNSQ